MALIATSAPNQTVSSGSQSVIHIRSIGVKFKAERPKYPISLKAHFRENDGDKSKRYVETEDVHWLCEKRLSPDSKFTIIVREHHSLRRTIEVMKIPISVSDLVTKPFFEADSGKSPVSLKIHSSAGGPFIEVIRRLVEQSQVRLEAMKIFLEKLGRICEALDYVVSITDAVSSVHPAAESAASMAASLLELCQKVQECHTSACELMEDVSTFLPFTDIPERGLKCKVTTQTTEEMLALFEEICRAIIKYSNGSVLGGLLDDRLEEIRSFKGKFGRMKETFRWCLTTEIWKTTLKIEENTDILLLRNLLSPVLGASYNENRHCFEGSRRDTLQTIEKWSESESSPKLFWLHGSAGLGKTTIAHTVAKLFHDQNRLAGCFFPSDRQNSKHVMPTIAYHLAKWHADYQKYILDVLRSPQEVDVFSGLGGQFDLLVKRPMLEINICSPPSHKPLIIVLDGLENCFDTEGSRRSFVNFIVDIATLVPWLKVFVSSRWSEDIRRHFCRAKVQYFAIDDPMLDLRHDIDAYATLCTDSPESHELWTPGMTNDVHGLFIRISGSLAALGAIGDTEILDPTIRDLDIEAFFRLLLESIVERRKLRDDDVPVVRCTLAIMSCVASIRPPMEKDLHHFLRLILPDSDITQDHLHCIIDSLNPIIFSEGENTLRILFPPDIFSGFLSGKQSGRFFMDTDSLKHRLAQYCSTIMRKELKFNICSFPSSFMCNDEVNERLDTCISEALRTCSQYWIGSVAQLEDAQDLIGAVAEFFRPHRALFWIEVLSLVGKLDVGKDGLSKCMTQFKSDDGILSPAKELHTFVSHFEPALKLSAPHVYVSALIWLPSDSSIVADIACSLSPKPSITFERVTEPAENAVRIDSRRGISCTTRSPDGSRIVSGNKEGRLEIWDGWTGEEIGEPIKGHSYYINDVKYSSDGTKFVSGSSDKTVKIWDAWTGRPIKELKSNSGVYAVAYSPDGSRVVSGHNDGRIRIWDAQKGTIIVELQDGHEWRMLSVAYLPDGRRIVSGSRDNTVRIWDAKSGAAVGEPLIGHKNYVNSVAYSPDGSRIVSGSNDETVRIWDAHTGIPVGEPLKGHEDCVVDVGYSQDGKTIMSASWDKTIRFWNATDGTPTGVLRRGKSRWDPVRRHFVSVPKWWPDSIWGRPFNLQSLVYSSNPLYVPDDGWIRTLDGGLILWVPLEHRACSCHAASESTLTGNPCDERLKKSGWEDVPRWADVVEIMNTDEPGRD